MVEEYAAQNNFDAAALLRDLEEQQHLLKERTLLIGRSLIQEREKMFNEIQTLKKTLLVMQEEQKRARELIQRIAEQLSLTVRKEELLILQRQFDLFRKE